jgi:hypothetical protein
MGTQIRSNKNKYTSALANSVKAVSFQANLIQDLPILDSYFDAALFWAKARSCKKQIRQN